MCVGPLLIVVDCVYVCDPKASPIGTPDCWSAGKLVAADLRSTGFFSLFFPSFPDHFFLSFIYFLVVSSHEKKKEKEKKTMGGRMAKLFLFCIAPVAVCCAVLIDKRLRDASRMHKRSQQEPMMGALKGHHPSSPATTTTTSHHQLTTTAAAAAAAASASTGCPSCKRISTSYNTRASHEIGRKRERERLARSYITLLLLRVGCQ